MVTGYGSYMLFLTFITYILAWDFVTRSCLKPQNPCSNYEIHVLFEHGFYIKKRKLGPDLHALRTLECVAAVTDHFADAFVRENVARAIYDVVET